MHREALPRRGAAAIYHFFLVLILAGGANPCSAESLTRLLDAPTGIELALPLDVLVSTKPGRWGTNWRSAGDRLNVDTLNFGSERHLAEVYASLKKSRGRRLTRDVLDQQQFVLEGTDGDGSSFYVTAVENNGAVRGLSIVYANRASEPLVKAIAASFAPFPGAATPPASPPADPGVARSEPAPPAPPPTFSRPPTANLPPAPEKERSALRCSQSPAAYITVRPADPQRDGCSGAACYVFENTCPAMPIKVRYRYSLGAGAACGPLQDAENTAPREESGKPGSFLDWSCSRPTIVGAEFEN